MEIEVVTEDSLIKRIKEDINYVLALYSCTKDCTTMFYNICTTDGILDYIENTDVVEVDKDEIHSATVSTIENFLSDAKYTLCFSKEKLEEFKSDKDSLADEISLLLNFKIQAILAAKKRRKKVSELDKEIAVYQED